MLLPICISAAEEAVLNNKKWTFNRAFYSDFFVQVFLSAASGDTRVHCVCVYWVRRQDYTKSNGLLLALHQNNTYVVVVQSERGEYLHFGSSTGPSVQFTSRSNRQIPTKLIPNFSHKCVG